VLHLATNTWYILRDTEFTMVDPVPEVRADGGVSVLRRGHDGVASWLNQAWALYFAHKWYSCQPYELYRQHVTQVARSQWIRPKPVFIDVDISDLDQAICQIVILDTSCRLLYPRDGGTGKDFSAWNTNPKVFYPFLHALKCLFAGVEKAPPHLNQSESGL
jgi:hypothetical protein